LVDDHNAYTHKADINSSRPNLINLYYSPETIQFETTSGRVKLFDPRLHINLSSYTQSVAMQLQGDRRNLHDSWLNRFLIFVPSSAYYTRFQTSDENISLMSIFFYLAISNRVQRIYTFAPQAQIAVNKDFKSWQDTAMNLSGKDFILRYKFSKITIFIY
jgi:hypothetical protein